PPAQSATSRNGPQIEARPSREMVITVIGHAPPEMRQRPSPGNDPSKSRALDEPARMGANPPLVPRRLPTFRRMTVSMTVNAPLTRLRQSCGRLIRP
ncbi:MAG TPA: hypothetical protein VN716_26845, partial [Vicinamibacterales bacterium]|nr:hypothetical protein [Vicinamibacterales bacterium]